MDIGICGLGEGFTAQTPNMLRRPVGEPAQGSKAHGLETKAPGFVDTGRHANLPPCTCLSVLLGPIVQGNLVDDMPDIFFSEPGGLEHFARSGFIMQSTVEGLVRSFDIQIPPVSQSSRFQCAVVTPWLEVDLDRFEHSRAGHQVPKYLAE
jgi:hypothetical protein